MVGGHARDPQGTFRPRVASWHGISLYQNEVGSAHRLLAPAFPRQNIAHHHDERHRAMARAISSGQCERAAAMGDTVVCGIQSAYYMVRAGRKYVRGYQGAVDASCGR